MESRKAKAKANKQQLNVQIQQVEEQYSCCYAKLFMIPETYKWVMTLCLIQIPTILHEILHIEWFSHNHLFAVLYLLFAAQFVNFWTFVNLCIQDPGFIQKIAQKYGYQIEAEFTNIPKNEQMNNYLEIQFVAVSKQMVTTLKLCSTCNIYRPNRASHCNQCGICVERMDHHCSWIGNCIGKKNYKYFFLFVFSLVVLIIITMIMCIMIMVGADDDPPNFSNRLKNYPLTIVFVIVPCFPALVYLSGLFFFHLYLITHDLTTKQVLGQKWIPFLGNPQRKLNCIKNVAKLFIKVQQSKSKYKHQAFPYYNNEAQDSSQPGNFQKPRESSQSSAKKKANNNSWSESAINKDIDHQEGHCVESKVDKFQEIYQQFEPNKFKISQV